MTAPWQRRRPDPGYEADEHEPRNLPAVPGEAEPVILEGQVVSEPPSVPLRAVHVIRTVARHERSRTAGRNVAYIGIGAAVVTKRMWESRSIARYERSIRSAEAAGDHEAALAWDVQRVKFIKDRHTRRADLVELPLKVAKELPKIAAGFSGCWRDRRAAGRRLEERTRGGQPGQDGREHRGVDRDRVFRLLGPVPAGLPWIVALVLWRIGRCYANAAMTGWAVARKRDEDSGVVITADTVVLAMQNLPIRPCGRRSRTAGHPPSIRCRSGTGGAIRRCSACRSASRRR